MMHTRRGELLFRSKMHDRLSVLSLFYLVHIQSPNSTLTLFLLTPTVIPIVMQSRSARLSGLESAAWVPKPRGNGLTTLFFPLLLTAV